MTVHFVIWRYQAYTKYVLEKYLLACKKVTIDCQMKKKKNHITQILFCSNMYQEKGWTAYNASTLQFQPPLCTSPSKVRHIFVQEERNSFSHYPRLEVTVYIPVIIWEFMSLQITRPTSISTRSANTHLRESSTAFRSYFCPPKGSE